MDLSPWTENQPCKCTTSEIVPSKLRYSEQLNHLIKSLYNEHTKFLYSTSVSNALSPVQKTILPVVSNEVSPVSMRVLNKHAPRKPDKHKTKLLGKNCD